MTQPDTARRSLDHWSEAGRAEMLAFYALAVEDYRRLAAARDWSVDLRAHVVDGRVRLLDVACGSVVEGFLQRCAFDDTTSLEQMESVEPLASYLRGCRGADGAWTFSHDVHLMTWEGPARPE